MARDKVTRREALSKLGGAMVGAALGFSGVERLARAAAAEMKKPSAVRPLANQCGVDAITKYGCDFYYDNQWHCEEGHWDCAVTGFRGCPPDVGAMVYCNSFGQTYGGTFKCWRGPENDPYGCIERKFSCNFMQEGHGYFRCGDGGDDVDDFNCNPDNFRCLQEPYEGGGEKNQFACEPPGTFTQCG